MIVSSLHWVLGITCRKPLKAWVYPNKIEKLRLLLELTLIGNLCSELRKFHSGDLKMFASYLKSCGQPWIYAEKNLPSKIRLYAQTSKWLNIDVCVDFTNSRIVFSFLLLHVNWACSAKIQHMMKATIQLFCYKINIQERKILHLTSKWH